jgi:hypothetical protein
MLPPVVLEFVFCAKTRLPKLRTKTRAITIPKFFLTDVSPFDVPLGRHLIMIKELLNFERDHNGLKPSRLNNRTGQSLASNNECNVCASLRVKRGADLRGL